MTITVAYRFRGPARSGNGGYTAGLLARALTPAADVPVRVRLQAPPPLDTPLSAEVDHAAGTATLRHAGAPVAVATPASFAHDPVPPVPAEVASTAGPFAGVTEHPFPGCFVCGPERDDGDGLRLFPGSLGPGRTACVWHPGASITGTDGAVPAEMVWAALDCPGGWATDLVGRAMVLGTMTAVVHRAPAVGEACVVLGRLDANVDRRSLISTAVYGADGDLVGRAEAVWVQVDADAFNRLEAPDPDLRRAPELR